MALDLWDKVPPVGVPNRNDPQQSGAMVRGRLWFCGYVTTK